MFFPSNVFFFFTFVSNIGEAFSEEWTQRGRRTRRCVEGAARLVNGSQFAHHQGEAGAPLELTKSRFTSAASKERKLRALSVSITWCIFGVSLVLFNFKVKQTQRGSAKRHRGTKRGSRLPAMEFDLFLNAFLHVLITAPSR